MSVFRNYNSQKSGQVNANAFPRVHPIPWQPTQRNVRSNPGIPSQPQRIQPQERGTFFPTSASSGGTLAPSMSSGCANCAGGCGNGTSASTPLTATQLATEHAQPGGEYGTRIHAIRPRVQPRGVGALRSTLSSQRSPRLIGLGGRGIR